MSTNRFADGSDDDMPRWQQRIRDTHFPPSPFVNGEDGKTFGSLSHRFMDALIDIEASKLWQWATAVVDKKFAAIYQSVSPGQRESRTHSSAAKSTSVGCPFDGLQRQWSELLEKRKKEYDEQMDAAFKRVDDLIANARSKAQEIGIF